MNGIERRLDIQAKNARSHVDEYLENPEEFSQSDVEAFNQAVTTAAVANWAVTKKLQSNHDMAKKIIDSI